MLDFYFSAWFVATQVLVPFTLFLCVLMCVNCAVYFKLPKFRQLRRRQEVEDLQQRILRPYYAASCLACELTIMYSGRA